jgi:hypothetical protein
LFSVSRRNHLDLDIQIVIKTRYGNGVSNGFNVAQDSFGLSRYTVMDRSI